jgi:hypothetical protein
VDLGENFAAQLFASVAFSYFSLREVFRSELDTKRDADIRNLIQLFTAY